MKCVLCGEFMAFLKGLDVLHVFKIATGAMLQGRIPLSAVATGEEIPTHRGWKRIAQARAANSKSHQRPRKRH